MLDHRTPLLSSLDSIRATDAAIELVLDRRTLLLSSFASVRATDATIDHALDSSLHRTGIVLDRTEA